MNHLAPSGFALLVSWTAPADSGLEPWIRIVIGRTPLNDIRKVDLNARVTASQAGTPARISRPDTYWMVALHEAGYSHEDIQMKVISEIPRADTAVECLAAYEARQLEPPLAVAAKGWLSRAQRITPHPSNRRLVYFYAVYDDEPSQVQFVRPFIISHTVMNPVLKLRLWHKQLDRERELELKPKSTKTVRNQTSYELDFLDRGENARFILLGAEFLTSGSFNHDERCLTVYFPRFRDSELGQRLQARHEARTTISSTPNKVQVNIGDPLLI